MGASSVADDPRKGCPQRQPCEQPLGQWQFSKPSFLGRLTTSLRGGGAFTTGAGAATTFAGAATAAVFGAAFSAGTAGAGATATFSTGAGLATTGAAGAAATAFTGCAGAGVF